MKVQTKIFNHFFPDIKSRWKHKWKVVISYLIVSIYCITNVKKRFPKTVFRYKYSRLDKKSNCNCCLRLFRKKKKLESRNKVCGTKEFCNIMMPCKDTSLIELYQYQKSDKALFSIYAYLESLTDVKIILTVHLQQKEVFQCLQCNHLKAQKISMMYAEIKIA